MLALLGVLLGSYLIGALNSALIISRLALRPDPRTQGSGNPGATNMFRINHSKWLGVATLLGDAGKGAAAVWLAFHFTDGLFPPAWPSLGVLAGVMVVVGHMWPVWHGFRGGKGVATLAGMMAVLHPLLLLMGVVTWLFAWWLYRRVAVASIAIGAAFPVYALALHARWDLLAAALFLGGVVVYRHKKNLRRLPAGEKSEWPAK